MIRPTKVNSTNPCTAEKTLAWSCKGNISLKCNRIQVTAYCVVVWGPLIVRVEVVLVVDDFVEHDGGGDEHQGEAGHLAAELRVAREAEVPLVKCQINYCLTRRNYPITVPLLCLPLRCGGRHHQDLLRPVSAGTRVVHICRTRHSEGRFTLLTLQIY